MDNATKSGSVTEDAAGEDLEVDWGTLLNGSHVLELLYRLQVMHPSLRKAEECDDEKVAKTRKE